MNSGSHGAWKGDGAAEYVATVSTHLRDIAFKNDLEFLAYLLDMVVDEAWRIVSAEEADQAIARMGECSPSIERDLPGEPE